MKTNVTEPKYYARTDRVCPTHLIGLDEESLYCYKCDKEIKTWLVVGDRLEVLARVSGNSSTFYEPPRFLSEPVVLAKELEPEPDPQLS